MTEHTDTAPLRAELERVAETPREGTIHDLLARMRPELEKALPQQIGAERFTRTVLTELRRTPKLLECSPESLLGAMMLAAQLGLEPGPLGHVYLVPFKGQVEFIIGYKGVIDLAYRSGLVKSVQANIVRAGDHFEYRRGTRAFLDHAEIGPAADREWTHVYAAAALKTGGAVFDVLFPEDVEKRRKRSANGSSPLSPWQTDTGAMWRKSAVRALAPYLPQSPLFGRALDVDEQPAPLLDESPVEPSNGGA